MKLSRNTIAILRNFSKINAGIRFREGRTLRTLDLGKRVLGETELEEECPVEASLIDLKELLLLATKSDRPLELSFDVTHSEDFPLGCATVSEVETKLHIGSVACCEPEWIKGPPDQGLPGAERADFGFNLTAADLAYLTRALDERRDTIMVDAIGETVDLKKITQDSIVSSIRVRNRVPDANPFQGVIKIEHLKRLMPGPYAVHIFPAGMALFMYEGFPLRYWVGFENARK